MWNSISQQHQLYVSTPPRNPLKVSCILCFPLTSSFFSPNWYRKSVADNGLSLPSDTFLPFFICIYFYISNIMIGLYNFNKKKTCIRKKHTGWWWNYIYNMTWMLSENSSIHLCLLINSDFNMLSPHFIQRRDIHI